MRPSAGFEGEQSNHKITGLPKHTESRRETRALDDRRERLDQPQSLIRFPKHSDEWTNFQALQGIREQWRVARVEVAKERTRVALIFDSSAIHALWPRGLLTGTPGIGASARRGRSRPRAAASLL